MFGFHSFTICLLAASLVLAAPSRRSDAGSSLSLLNKRQNDTSSSDKMVFCHFMMGIVSDRTSAADYDSDMKLAKDLGIDAFALNIGTDDFTNTQLGYAYESAANNDMKVFISFDFNWFSPTDDAAKVGQMIANYSTQSSQLMVDGNVFASSFSGDGLNVADVKTAAGIDVFFAPNFSPGKTASADSIDGALNWMGWASNGDNKAPTASNNVTVVDGDDSYDTWLGSKSYIAPVSPWFNTHYGAEVSYSKNFVFPGDLLWYNRWNEVLTQSPRFVEIITWNDYGESHYIGPLSSKHTDDGASKWVNDMPHNGFRDLAKPYIQAFKAGAASPDQYITEDQVVYWYRPTLSTADCDSTDNTIGGGSSNNASGNFFIGKPNGYGDLEDSVFVVTLLTADGSLSVTSGNNTQTFDAKAGVNAFQVPMAAGQQTFSLTRDSKTVLSGTSLKDIQDECICGIYNFNTYVGTLPEEAADSLDADGLASFTVGLHVTTCSATPSLGTPTAVAASATGGGSVVATGGSQPTATSVAPTPVASGSNVVASVASQTQVSASATSTGTSGCNGGTNADGQSGNLSGLCNFACNYGFCPLPACKCTSTGTPVSTGTPTASTACGISGEDSALYDDLCTFTCSLGYCPDTACTTSCST